MLICDVCNGAKVLPDDIEYNPEKGKFLKDERIAAGLTLRQQAIADHADVVELSRNERGFFRKGKL
jgi:hypothetical protein